MSARRASGLFAAWLVAAAAACSSQHPVPAAGGMALPFIENDFAVASARAKEAKLPLFVEVWAPW